MDVTARDLSVSTRDLSVRLSSECGTTVDVSWSFRLFQLVCLRADGESLTPSMEAAFDRLLQFIEQLPAHIRDSRI